MAVGAVAVAVANAVNALFLAVVVAVLFLVVYFEAAAAPVLFPVIPPFALALLVEAASVCFSVATINVTKAASFEFEYVYTVHKKPSHFLWAHLFHHHLLTNATIAAAIGKAMSVAAIINVTKAASLEFEYMYIHKSHFIICGSFIPSPPPPP